MNKSKKYVAPVGSTVCCNAYDCSLDAKYWDGGLVKYCKTERGWEVAPMDFKCAQHANSKMFRIPNTVAALRADLLALRKDLQRFAHQDAVRMSRKRKPRCYILRTREGWYFTRIDGADKYGRGIRCTSGVPPQGVVEYGTKQEAQKELNTFKNFDGTTPYRIYRRGKTAG